MDIIVIRDVYLVFVIIMVIMSNERDLMRMNCCVLGSTTEVCHKETGGCICKANFTGQTCEQCAPGFFNHPTCEPCACDSVGVVYDGKSIK